MSDFVDLTVISDASLAQEIQRRGWVEDDPTPPNGNVDPTGGMAMGQNYAEDAARLVHQRNQIIDAGIQQAVAVVPDLTPDERMALARQLEALPTADMQNLVKNNGIGQIAKMVAYDRKVGIPSQTPQTPFGSAPNTQIQPGGVQFDDRDAGIIKTMAAAMGVSPEEYAAKLKARMESKQ